MIQVEIVNLAAFLRHFDSIEIAMGHANVQAVNEVGDTTRQEIIDLIADETTLPATAIARYVTAKRANRSDKIYEINVRRALLEQEVERISHRGYQGRGRGPFEEDMLVVVATANDDHVCEICQQIRLEGPYSMEEIRALQAKHPHFLNRDLNCRCALRPARFVGRTREQARERGKPTISTQRTLSQLAQQVAANTRVVLSGRIK
jgi:hypothetical protein